MALKPTDTFKCVVPADRHKATDEQRVLIYQHQTMADWLDYSAELERLQADGVGYVTLGKGLIELARRGLVGWEGVTKAFDGHVGDIFTPLELLELCRELPDAAIMDEVDRKKSQLQLQSQQGNCARDVDGTVATDQAMNDQLDSPVSSAKGEDVQAATIAASGS